MYSIEDYEKVIRKNPIVHSALKAGLSLSEIIVLMDKQQDQLLEKLMELHRLSPIRMQMPDGRIVVYRMPDELIPLTDYSVVPPGFVPETKTNG